MNQLMDAPFFPHPPLVYSGHVLQRTIGISQGINHRDYFCEHNSKVLISSIRYGLSDLVQNIRSLQFSLQTDIGVFDRGMVVHNIVYQDAFNPFFELSICFLY